MTNEASMGPRRCRRGRPKCRTPLDSASGIASMGPRRCRRGRRSGSINYAAAATSFNGATPMSAWKTHDRWHERRSTSTASMGPRRCRRGRQGGIDSSAITTRFNGATPMSAWKTADVPADDLEVGASMGPRRCRRGRPRWVWGHHTDLPTSRAGIASALYSLQSNEVGSGHQSFVSPRPSIRMQEPAAVPIPLCILIGPARIVRGVPTSERRADA